jgi:molybdopterin-guanine dinucleotide biosynthesis protein A
MSIPGLHKVNGYILAGGKSSRMGTDKGLLLLKGKPLVQWVIDGMRQSVNEIFIVSGNPLYKQFNVPVIDDELKNAGPAAGIYTAISHSHTPLNFIVSCDTPMISKPAVDFLIEQAQHHQVTVPVFNGFIHPLFGVYASGCKEDWKKLMDRGVLKLQDLITNFDLLKTDVSQHQQFTEIFFTNLNSKQDLDELQKQLD